MRLRSLAPDDDIAVVDLDCSSLSRQLVRYADAHETLRVAARFASVGAAEAGQLLLIRGPDAETVLQRQEALLPAIQIHKSRELAARLLNAKPEEIAFVGPTTLALSWVSSIASARLIASLASVRPAARRNCASRRHAAEK